MYLPYQAVHGPLEVPEQYTKPFQSKIEDKDRLTLAGMTSCMDEGIANITQTLKETGLYNNTIIIFSTGKIYFCVQFVYSQRIPTEFRVHLKKPCREKFNRFVTT